MEQDALERHLLYVLLDSNLPTGGFVASSGLESYSKHGFFTQIHLSGLQRLSAQRIGVQDALIQFTRSSVHNYGKTTLGFVRDAWTILDRLKASQQVTNNDRYKFTADLTRLDEHYEAMTLNHVTKRSSTAQGIALLTLLTKGFAQPNFANATSENERNTGWWKETVDTFKKKIRRGEAFGHLPICWGILTSAMGLAVGSSTPFILSLADIY